MKNSKGSAPATDASHEWEIRSILGQKIVGQEVYYRVNWEPTWMPESALGGARYLIDKFITQLYDPHECRNVSREGGCSKRGWQENMEPCVWMSTTAKQDAPTAYLLVPKVIIPPGAPGPPLGNNTEMANHDSHMCQMT